MPHDLQHINETGGWKFRVLSVHFVLYKAWVLKSVSLGPHFNPWP